MINNRDYTSQYDGYSDFDVDSYLAFIRGNGKPHPTWEDAYNSYQLSNPLARLEGTANKNAYDMYRVNEANRVKMQEDLTALRNRQNIGNAITSGYNFMTGLNQRDKAELALRSMPSLPNYAITPDNPLMQARLNQQLALSSNPLNTAALRAQNNNISATYANDINAIRNANLGLPSLNANLAAASLRRYKANQDMSSNIANVQEGIDRNINALNANLQNIKSQQVADKNNFYGIKRDDRMREMAAASELMKAGNINMSNAVASGIGALSSFKGKPKFATIDSYNKKDFAYYDNLAKKYGSMSDSEKKLFESEVNNSALLSQAEKNNLLSKKDTKQESVVNSNSSSNNDTIDYYNKMTKDFPENELNTYASKTQKEREEAVKAYTDELNLYSNLTEEQKKNVLTNINAILSIKEKPIVSTPTNTQEVVAPNAAQGTQATIPVSGEQKPILTPTRPNLFVKPTMEQIKGVKSKDDYSAKLKIKPEEIDRLIREALDNDEGYKNTTPSGTAERNRITRRVINDLFNLGNNAKLIDSFFKSFKE